MSACVCAHSDDDGTGPSLRMRTGNGKILTRTMTNIPILHDDNGLPDWDLHRQDTRQRRLTYVPHRDLHRNDMYDDDDCVDGLPVCDLHRKDKYVRTTTTTMLTMAAIGK